MILFFFVLALTKPKKTQKALNKGKLCLSNKDPITMGIPDYRNLS